MIIEHSDNQKQSVEKVCKCADGVVRCFVVKYGFSV